MTSSGRPFAPLQRQAFRWLWVGVLITYAGVWMQVVGVQWTLVSASGSVTAVALVPTAALLPIALGALPAGLLADRCDRRWLLLGGLASVVVVAGSSAVLSATGRATPTQVLIFTCLLGIAVVVLRAGWQAVIMELVPRAVLGAAHDLDRVAGRLGGLVGATLAGLVISTSGVWNAFALNAFSVVPLGLALLLWHRAPLRPPRVRDRYGAALRASARCVRRQPAVQLILVRTVLFAAPGAALWALLPVVARQQLGVGAGGYGALVAALGAGAVAATLLAGWMRGRVANEAQVAVGGIVFAGVLVVIALVPVLGIVLLACLIAGWAWATVVSALRVQLDPLLPRWLRSGGLVLHPVVLAAAVAVPAVVWGQVAGLIGVRGALLVAAAALLAGVVIAAARPGRLER